MTLLMVHLILTILDCLLVIVGIMTTVLLLLPRGWLYLWFKRREGNQTLHFKTAATLYEHLLGAGEAQLRLRRGK
jgi:hypothetical protein